jgi:nucleoid DNA-binding protein
MRTSVGGREELAARVEQALALGTKKEAMMVVDAVVSALEATLLNNLGVDGFTLKLGSFGKLSVRHKPGILRRIPFTGETILTKDRRKVTFVSLGQIATKLGLYFVSGRRCGQRWFNNNPLPEQQTQEPI